MARKKEAPKQSPEERMMDRWNQQTFFLTKQFPTAQSKINTLRKSLENKGAFAPTEEALNELTDLYVEMKLSQPRANAMPSA